MSLSPRQRRAMRDAQQNGVVRAGAGGHPARTLRSLVRLGLLEEQRNGDEQWFTLTTAGAEAITPADATDLRVRGGLMLCFVSDVEAVVSNGPLAPEGRLGLRQALRDHYDRIKS